MAAGEQLQTAVQLPTRCSTASRLSTFAALALKLPCSCGKPSHRPFPNICTRSVKITLARAGSNGTSLTADAFELLSRLLEKNNHDKLARQAVVLWFTTGCIGHTAEEGTLTLVARGVTPTPLYVALQACTRRTNTDNQQQLAPDPRACETAP